MAIKELNLLSKNEQPLPPGRIAQAKSILLVDDSIVLRDRLALAFQERGFEVAVAGNADEALVCFARAPTDLAVLDLRMPGKPGLVLLQELKKISPTTKFLILSGFGSIATAIDAAGGEGHPA